MTAIILIVVLVFLRFGLEIAERSYFANVYGGNNPQGECFSERLNEETINLDEMIMAGEGRHESGRWLRKGEYDPRYYDRDYQNSHFGV